MPLKKITKSCAISVILPAYNCADTIARAMDSILAQSYEPVEVIVVDDGSTDRTAEVVKGYGDSLRYIRQENAGVSAACNTGIKAASGDWIAFLDADDHWLPEKLQLQVSLLERNPQLRWVACNYFYHSCQTDQRQPVLQADECEKLLDGRDSFENFICAAIDGVPFTRSTMLIHKTVFDKVGMFQEGLSSGEDLDLSLRISYHWPCLGFVRQPAAVYYYQRPGSLAARSLGRRMRIRFDMFDKHLELSGQYGYDEDYCRYLAKIMPKFLYLLYLENERDTVNEALKRYGKLLPFSYRIGLKGLQVFWPARMPYASKIARKILGI